METTIGSPQLRSCMTNFLMDASKATSTNEMTELLGSYFVLFVSLSALRCWKLSRVSCSALGISVAGWYPRSLLAREMSKRRLDAAILMRFLVKSEAAIGRPINLKSGIICTLTGLSSWQGLHFIQLHNEVDRHTPRCNLAR